MKTANNSGKNKKKSHDLTNIETCHEFKLHIVVFGNMVRNNHMTCITINDTRYKMMQYADDKQMFLNDNNFTLSNTNRRKYLIRFRRTIG